MTHPGGCGSCGAASRDDLPRIGRIDDEIRRTGRAARGADVRRFINWFGEFPVGTVSG